MLRRLKELVFPGKEFAKEADDESTAAYLPREKFLVFAISFVLAFCLWFIVNLSRDFNITISLPLEVINLPAEMALVNDPPDIASVGVMGEGWKLISLYNNPPRIQVDASEEDANLFEMVRQQISVVSEVNITKVQPLVLNLNQEEKAYKEVPVEPLVDIGLRSRYSLVGEPRIEPDTVTVSGAESKINDIEKVSTRQMELENVDEGQEVALDVILPAAGVSVTPSAILYSFEVTEFTEGELRIPVRIRNLPPGRAVTYNPSSVTVRYDIPIDQYSDVQNTRPFIAYVDYNEIEADTTGLVAPRIERTEDGYDIRLRSFQPRTVSYFNVVRNN